MHLHAFTDTCCSSITSLILYSDIFTDGSVPSIISSMKSEFRIGIPSFMFHFLPKFYFLFSVSQCPPQRCPTSQNPLPTKLTHCPPSQPIVMPSLLPSETDLCHGFLPPRSAMRFIAWVSMRKLVIVGSKSLSSVVGSGSTDRRGGALPLSLPHRRGGEVRIFALTKHFNCFNLSLCCYLGMNWLLCWYELIVVLVSICMNLLLYEQIILNLSCIKKKLISCALCVLFF